MQVYFIQVGDDGPIKIGRTKNINIRLMALQTGHHRNLRVIHLETPDKGESLKLEKKLHSEFAGLHIRREWFRPGLALLEYIGKAPLSWGKIAAVDEDLKFLYQDALIAECEEEDFEYECSINHYWYRVLKPQMVRIVGFGRKYDPVELQGTEAYEIAYHKIYDAIPCPKRCKKRCRNRH